MTYAVRSVGLAPLAVAESHRNKGIGTSLCKAGLDKVKEMGFDLAFVLGSEKYYPRFGFKRARDFGIKSPYPDTEEHFFVIEFRPGALQQAKGIISYAPEFDGL